MYFDSIKIHLVVDSPSILTSRILLFVAVVVDEKILLLVSCSIDTATESSINNDEIEFSQPTSIGIVVVIKHLLADIEQQCKCE